MGIFFSTLNSLTLQYYEQDGDACKLGAGVWVILSRTGDFTVWKFRMF